MSTRNLIGFGQSSLLKSVCVHYISHAPFVRKRNLQSDERHTIILVTWFETFIFKRGVIIQMMQIK